MIKVQRTDSPDYSVLEITGTPVVNDFVEYIGTYFKSRSSNRTIWDFTNCPMEQLNVADYAKIIAAVKRHTGISGEYRTALVFQSEIEQILGETFEAMAMASHLPVEYAVFGSVSAAVEWVANS